MKIITLLLIVWNYDCHFLKSVLSKPYGNEFALKLLIIHFPNYIMTQSVALSLLNLANNGNELLAVLDSLVEDANVSQGEEVSPFA